MCTTQAGNRRFFLTRKIEAYLNTVPESEEECQVSLFHGLMELYQNMVANTERSEPTQEEPLLSLLYAVINVYAQ